MPAFVAGTKSFLESPPISAILLTILGFIFRVMRGDSKKLLVPATKEVAVDAASGGVWVNRTPQQVIWMEVDGITPGEIGHAVRSNPAPSPVLIGSGITSPTCGLSGSLQVANKQQSTSPVKVRNAQKLDTVIDGKFPNDWDYMSIFSKVVGKNISDTCLY